MNISIFSLFITVLVAFISGVIIPITISIIQRRNDLYKQHLERLDKYKLVAIEKRLEVAQKAFSYWLTLKPIIHNRYAENRQQIINEAKQFWNNNCLYLNKNSRLLFWRIICDTSEYPDLDDAIRNAFSETDKNNARKNKLDAWDRIYSFPDVLAEEMDLELPHFDDVRPATDVQQ